MDRAPTLRKAPWGPAVVFWSLAALPQTAAFYLPGVAPMEYQEGARVDLKVNKLTSVKTQLPYRYYFLPFCQPKDLHVSAENLGEILTGDSIENSLYDIRMNVNNTCAFLCSIKMSEDDKTRFKHMIDDEYQVNWLVDNLPAATRYHSAGEEGFTYMNGFPIGLKQAGKYFVHNHARIGLQYHQDPGEFEGFRVVGFEVYPMSIKQTMKGDKATCKDSFDAPQLNMDKNEEIMYTYDVIWTQSDVRWASRW